jgi:DNA-binding HxlR family transcriptional regulator
MDNIQPLASEDCTALGSRCPVEVAAQIIGQKWTLQIVNKLMDRPSRRFCEIQEELGGVNPGTLSSRLKMLEEEGIIRRVQVSAIPPHVEYSLTQMGAELHEVLQAVTRWSKTWLCTPDRLRVHPLRGELALPAAAYLAEPHL